MTSAIRPANRLALETSPYLLQHAHNPVDWYPWGPEALELALSEDRPILLSVGYSACHWCHVMERECFENESIAALMNEHFICIKVDREERPDIDDVYMAATLAINGNGGWPMTVFCTPEQSPFFAGTYFPPDDRQGRPGFPSLLRRIADLWQNDRDALFRQAGELTDHLRSQTALSPPKSVSETATAQALLQLKRSFDSEHGGFGDAPKFPPSQALHLLFRKHQSSGQPELLEMATRTLDAMKNGGIYDQLGGGFARYSVDAEWLVPHFEKMLYDNAQLARVYTEAFQVTGNPEYRRVASETLDYVITEMQAPEGGYYSATDADSEGVEGKFFVFTPKQLRAVLEPEETRVFCAYYDVTEEGNWEGTNVLHTPRSTKEVAQELKIDPDEFSSLLTRARDKAFAERATRVAPTTDDKVLTAWNSLMIGSMAEAFRVFGEERYLASAKRAAGFVLQHLATSDGHLLRTARAGKAHLAAVLEDYAYLCDALIDLYESSGETAYLEHARTFAQTLVRDFYDAESGTFFATAVDHEPLIVRRRDGNDGALPSASAVAARALLRLSRHFDSLPYREFAEALVRAYGERIERTPRSHLTLLNLMDDLLEAPVELVYAADDLAASKPLRDQVAQSYLPRRVIAHRYADSDIAPNRGLLEGKVPVQGKPTLFVCKNNQCEAPTTRPDEVSARLSVVSDLTRAARRQELRPRAVKGHATAEGTERYFARQRLHSSAMRRLNGCLVSRVGFGTHRVHDMSTNNQRALLLALREGCNLVETAPSYGAGASERTVGNSVTELVRAEVVARDELVLISKLGIIEGEDSRRLAALAEPPAHCFSLDNTTQYCLAPSWLDAQLQASLVRLNIDTLDVCLLHNPELLTDRGLDVVPQLVAAFGFLESAVASGTVRAYGVSSNVLHLANSKLSLKVVLEAKRLANATHCNVISLPYNAHERDALTSGVFSEAAAAGFSVLTQRPLDAFRDGVRQRLVSSPAVSGVQSVHEAKQEVAKLEHEFRAQLGAVLRAVPGAELKTDSFFMWSERIVPAVLTDRETWNEFERQHLAFELPRMLSAMEQAMRGKQIGQLWRSWRERYTHHMEQLVVAARHETKERSDLHNQDILTELRSAAPEAQQHATLSQLAVWFASSPAGVTTTLLGMRDPDYVRDALTTLRWPDWADPDEEA